MVRLEFARILKRCCITTKLTQHHQTQTWIGTFATHEGAEGSVTSILVGISTLNPSAAVDIIIPGICGCQCSSFKSF